MLHLINQLLQNDILWLVFQLGCLAIWKPKGVQIAKKYLETGFKNNKEGAGFVICKKNKLEITKGFFKFEEFWQAYKDLQKWAALIHFRIATHGKVEHGNCHPFEILGGKYAMVHNGILPFDPPKGNLESDSAYFANTILSPLLGALPYHAECVEKVVEEAIGGGNKIIVLRADGEPWIFNEICGWWHKGAWFSNCSFKSYSSWTGKGSYNCDSTGDYWPRMGSARLSEAEANDLAQLEGDMEYAPETEEQRRVQAWLEEQDRKSKSEKLQADAKVKDAVIRSDHPGETYSQKKEREAHERDAPKTGNGKQYLLN